MKSLIIRSLIILKSLLLANFIYGQSCELQLEGQISDLHDDSLLIGAFVSIQGTDFFSQTNLEGQYRFSGICPGNYILIVSHPNCKTIKKSIKLNESKTYNFNLEHHINELEEIILSESKISKLRKSVQEISFDLSKINAYGSNTLEEVIKQIPGASLLKTGNAIGKPIIHGMYGSRVGIIADDFRQYDQQWGQDHAPNIDFDSYEDIQLIKGAAALKYGGDIPAGAIILSSKRKLLKDTLFGRSSIHLESNGRGGKFSSRIEKNFSNGFYANGNFTGKRFGDFNAPNYLLSNTGYKEASFSLNFGKDLITQGWHINYSHYTTEPGILKASHIGNVQDLFFALNADTPNLINDFTYTLEAPKQLSIHKKILLKYFKTLKKNVKLELGYNYQNNSRKEFDLRRGGRTEIPVVDLLLKTHILNASISGIKYKNWDFELGINGFLQDNFSTPETGVKRLIPDYYKYEGGIYFLGNHQKNNSFLWEWGLRLDHVSYNSKKYYDQSVWDERNYDVLFSAFEIEQRLNQILTNPIFNYLNFSAQTGMAKTFFNAIHLKTSYILSQRAPNPSELFSDGLHHAIAAIEYGNLNLQPETNHKLLLSLSKKINKLYWSLDPFISKTFNYIFIQPTGLEQTIRGAFPVWSYETTDAYFIGLDFASSVAINNKISFDLGASYVYAQDILDDEPIILIPPFNSFQKLKFTPLKGKWTFEITQQISAKQNRFPNTNFIFNNIENGKIVSRIVDISESPAGFQKLDVIFSIRLKEQNSFKSQLRFIVHNLTNTSYRDYLNRMRFYASELGRSFQIQLNFKY